MADLTQADIDAALLGLENQHVTTPHPKAAAVIRRLWRERLGSCDRRARPSPTGEKVEAVAAIVPDHCSGSSLVFSDGILHVNKDGSGHIVVEEEDFEIETEYDEDGSRSDFWITRFPPSEMQALRDFLNGAHFDVSAITAALVAERDEWKSAAGMYEATAKEAARGLECLNDIDEAWDAFGTAGNRKALTLAEQIASRERELDDANARVARLEKALRRAHSMLTYPVSTEINPRGYSWRPEPDMEFDIETICDALTDNGDPK